jgi:uncharacterized protein with NAD-binding domain and iron-sulfur cluster
MHIAVLGAGILGVSSAVALAEGVLLYNFVKVIVCTGADKIWM